MIKKKGIRAVCALLAAVLCVSGAVHAQAGSAGTDYEVPTADGLSLFTGLTMYSSAGSSSETTVSDELARAQQELEEAQNEASSIQKEEKSARQRLEELQGLKSDVTAYLEALDENLAEAEQINYELEEQMAEKQEVIDETLAQLEEAQELESAQYEAMKLRIQYMYEAGQTRYLDILFEADSLTDLLTRAEYIQEMIDYDRDMLVSYQETRNFIEEQNQALLEEYAELEELQAQNEAAQADLEMLRETKTAELEVYTTQIDELNQQVNEYEKAVQEQENLVKQITAQIARQEEEERRRQEEELAAQLQAEAEAAENASEDGSADSSSGTTASSDSSSSSSSGSSSSSSSVSFIWPLKGYSTITSAFGERESPTEGASTNHKGIDISAPTGTPIYAAAGGEVVISMYSASAGNYIMIYHGNSTYTEYMHCSQRNVSVGDKVTQGQVIGLVGSTGYSTGPHLHFGLQINGSYVNPLNYVSP